jgi:hypothetical protein
MLPLGLWLYLCPVADVSFAQGPFRDVTREVGLDFRHDPLPADGAKRYFMPEIMGSGAALFDADGDGDLDVYMVQAAALDAKGRVVATGDRVNALFVQGDDHSFTNASTTSGLDDRGFGMGVAIGDIDGDALPEVLVTNYGPDVLYRNKGDGVFEKMPTPDGLDSDDWSASATFCDYDADGDLDLYVTHYLDYDPALECFRHDGGRDYCGPQEFPGVSDALFRNDGTGVLEDVSRESGIASVAAPGLGVVCLDLTGDGRLDFYVANDGKANQLWRNLGDGRFQDDAYLLGTALNSFGAEEAGMGIAPGDIDEDGDLDLLLTHLRNETNTLYRNDGALGFEDATHVSGLGALGIATTGFGTALLDFDHDGDLDLAIANGAVAMKDRSQSTSDPGSFWDAFAEPNVLVEQTKSGGASRFRIVSAADEFGREVEVSRALGVGDIDDDGDLDLLVTNTGGIARLFRNVSTTSSRPLLVRALDEKGRDAHGSVISIDIGDRVVTRAATPGYGYLTSNDPRAHFALPAGATIEHMTVQWPGGVRERFEVVGKSTSHSLTLRRGDGVVERGSQ